MIISLVKLLSLYYFWSHCGLILLNTIWSYVGYMVNIYLIAFVRRGKNRKTLLKLLSDKKKTQAELHHESNMYRTHVRRTLLELQKKKLVKCLNPKDRICKMYQITNLGKSVEKKLKELD